MVLSFDGKNSRVNLLDLSACCLSSAIVAADQITALACTAAGNKQNARLKIDGSFVTDADMAAQQIIVNALHEISNEIRIVGEENEEETSRCKITGHEARLESIFRLSREEILIRYHGGKDIHAYDMFSLLPLAQDGAGLSKEEVSLSKEETESNSTRPHRMKEIEIDTNRVSIFIDPLDGTNSYAKGDYGPVSILVAIIIDQTPCFGVICKPFGSPGQFSVLDTGCMAAYGGTLLGAAYIAGAGKIRGRKTTSAAEDPLGGMKRDHKELPRAVISRSRSKGIVQNFVAFLGEKGIIHPEPLLVSGAGEKSLRIIMGSENEGLWFFPKGGTSLWDVAASDALLRATGGRLTDKYGNDMDYSRSKTEAENKYGVVACYDELLHADCIRLFSEGTWED